MAGGEVERFRRRLHLLSQGRLVEAQGLVVGTSAAAKKAGGELLDDALGTLDDLDGGAAKQYQYDVASAVKRSAARSSKGEPQRRRVHPGGRRGAGRRRREGQRA
jgi:hypothetical protein